MSYDTVKNGIATRLNACGFTESSQVDFKTALANESGTRFIIKCLSGENQENTIIDRFDDAQDWQILIAFERSENNDITQLDALHRAKDILIADLDKPANWSSFAKILKYNKWTVEETTNFYVLDIRLFVLSEYIHG